MLRIQNVSFAYDTVPVLQNLSFSIKKGQHIALIGASGCGKSTLLKIIYGVLQLRQGQVFWEDKEVLGPDFNLVPGEAYMKYLSQGSELLSYRTVSENIGQFLSGTESELKSGRVHELLNIVEMTDFAQTKVESLSGGQKQRVALARALAKKPELLLLDEPFGNIDNFRRNSLRRNLTHYLKRNGITSITATHDKTDILSFADETIVIQEGKLLTQQPTIALYQDPKTAYTASLFGEVNTLPAKAFLQEFTDTDQFITYPDEVQCSANGTIQARVKRSYFNGDHFLIEAIYKRSIIFIKHHTTIPENQITRLTIDPQLIRKRIL